MNADKRRLDAITEKAIGCAFAVSNTLGSGFLEKVYENALCHEIKKSGLKVSQQHRINVLYDGEIVGEYIADLIIENSVLIEIKAVNSLDQIHAAQCLNYLKATELRICLLLNFGAPKVEVRRIVNHF